MSNERLNFDGKIEHKQVGFEVKEMGDDGSFKGYAAVYGNVDYGSDKIEAFAATRSLKKGGGKMPILRNHSAKIEDIVGENCEALEDEKGFKVAGQFNLDTDSGLDTYKKVKFAKEHGRPMGLSIGFRANIKKIDWVDGIRVLKEIDVKEYSVVVFPMNGRAKITSVKSFCETASDEEKAHMKRDFENLLRDAGASVKESKAAVSALFAQRDAEDEDEKKAAEEKELQEKKDAELKASLESCLSSITQNKR